MDQPLLPKSSNGFLKVREGAMAGSNPAFLKKFSDRN
jgi:hypothetical protein